MKHFGYLFVVLLCTSCQFFETEKLNTETLYEEELKTIDWTEVDQYPVFANCESLSEKVAQKHCFEQSLATQIHQAIERRNMTTVHTLHDTIMLQLEVSKTATIRAQYIAVDSVLFSEIPMLKKWIHESVDSMKLVAPAYKRGIPVATYFALPIVFTSETSPKN